MKKFIKKTIIFCIGIPVVILFLGYVEMIIKPSNEFRTLKTELPNTDVLIFGSSVDWHCAKEDTDKRKISEMLDSLMQNKVVTGVSHGAYHSEIYYEFVHFISKSKEKKPFIVVPINLRYFSPEWDMRPQYQFLKEKYEISGFPYIYNFKGYKEISTTEFNSHPIFFHETNIGNIGEITSQYHNQDKDETMRTGLIFHYMQPIDPNHRKLTALKLIAKICRESNIGLMMYITPIDIKRAEELEIDRFRMKILKNLFVIKQNLEIESVDLLDLSFYLDSEYFDYELIPNEHLNMKGRLKVAMKIKEKIIEFSRTRTHNNVQNGK